MAKLWLFQYKKEILYYCSHPGPGTSELIQEQIKIGVTSTVSQARLKNLSSLQLFFKNLKHDRFRWRFPHWVQNGPLMTELACAAKFGH